MTTKLIVSRLQRFWEIGIQTAPSAYQVKDPLNLRCRCGANASLVLCEDRSWKVACTKGHEGKPAKLPSDALAQWSLKLRRK